MRVATGQRIMSYEFLIRRYNEVWEWVWLFNELIINDTNALETGISKTKKNTTRCKCHPIVAQMLPPLKIWSLNSIRHSHASFISHLAKLGTVGRMANGVVRRELHGRLLLVMSGRHSLTFGDTRAMAELRRR